MTDKTIFEQLKEKQDMYKFYSQEYKLAKGGGIPKDVHGLVALIHEKKGEDIMADALRKTDQVPEMHGLTPLIDEGTKIFKKEYEEFGKEKLVHIAVGKGVDYKNVEEALLNVAPKENVSGFEKLSELHKEANEFYMQMALYQSPEVAPGQKVKILHNMKIRVMNDYKERFKDDKEYLEGLARFVKSYDDVALAQYEEVIKSKVDEFKHALDGTNAGKYAEAALSDKGRDIFYQALISLESKE